MKFSIAGVIILVPGHLRFLAELVENLNSAEPQFDHVMIVASGFSRKDRVLAIAESCTASRLQVFFSPLGSAGQNRNFAWNLVSEDLICFMDGDDLYAKNRNAIIRSVFKTTDCDLFLHGFQEFTETIDVLESEKLPKPFSDQNLVGSEKLDVQHNRDRASELRGETASTNLVFRNRAEEFRVHHAHITVKREIGQLVRFHEVFGVRNEDGVFAQDVLASGATVVLSPERLSYYRQGGRAKPRKKRGFFRFLFNSSRKTGELVVLRNGSEQSE